MLQETFSRMPDYFGNNVILRGQDYYAQGKVLNIRLSEGLLKARVKGNAGHIYDVHMDLKNWPAQPARCSCPAQHNCKHAAASLFALHGREHNQDPDQKLSKGLDKKLDAWLENLREQQEEKREKAATHRLIFILKPFVKEYDDDIEHRLSIDLALAKILKKGGLGKHTVFNHLTDNRKRHFIAHDEEIVSRLLYLNGESDWFHHLELNNSDLLDKIIHTDRAILEDDTPLKPGPEWSTECVWVLQPNGHQQIQLMHENEVVYPLLLDRPWYFNVKQQQMGPLKSNYSCRQLKHILNVPPVPLEQAELLAKKMKKSFPEFPAPIIFKQKEVLEIEPVPHLLFDCIDLRQRAAKRIGWSFYDEDDQALLYTAKLYFTYDDVSINYLDESAYVVYQVDGQLKQYLREKAFEKRKLDELEAVLPLRDFETFEARLITPDEFENQFVLDEYKSSSDLNHLYQEVIPLLKSKGWQIEFKSAAYEDILEADEIEWYSELNESPNDFFSYQLGILIDDKPVSIVPLVANLIGQYGSGEALDQLPDSELVKLPLGDGKVLRLAVGRIKPLVRLLLQYGLRHIQNDDQQLKINRYQLLLMQEAEQAMAATRARWQGAELLRGRLLQLANKKEIPEVSCPKTLKADLRDYQQDGLNWLQFLRQNQFAGILADDMGLGKTIQTLAHLLYEKQEGRVNRASLIVAPTSLVGNWEAESHRFTPDIKVLVFHGNDRHQDNFDDYDLVISTYGLIQRDKARFLDYDFYYLILDESQFIKNSRTKTTQIIQQLKASHRLCLTGTPLENHLGELWSLFHFLMPGLLGDAKQFRQWFKTPIEKYADESRRSILANRVKPFMLRRTKKEVAKELPPKTEMIRKIEISGTQRDLYEAIRMSMEKKVREAIARQGMGQSHIVLLDALLKLRQICCDPKLLSLPEAEMAHGTSAKLVALMELIDNLMEEDRSVLIFSQFTSMLKLIEAELVQKNYRYLKLTGQTQDRQKLVDRFQAGEVPIFLISLKAGGTGLNLTQADTVIHYDPWWNPAVEDQATDRSYRIGQENPVFVYKLITEGTVEEIILGMQERKRKLVDSVLSSNASGSLNLTDQDIAQFFSPINQD